MNFINKLDEELIQYAQAGKEPYCFFSEPDELMLVVLPVGDKIWCRYVPFLMFNESYLENEELGRYPILSLADARIKAKIKPEDIPRHEVLFKGVKDFLRGCYNKRHFEFRAKLLPLNFKHEETFNLCYGIGLIPAVRNTQHEFMSNRFQPVQTLTNETFNIPFILLMPDEIEPTAPEAETDIDNKPDQEEKKEEKKKELSKTWEANGIFYILSNDLEYIKDIIFDIG